MDEIALNEEKLQTLIKCAPTDEELEQVKGYEGEEELLGNPEKKFFRTISVIPSVAKRLECFIFKQRFDSVYGEIEKNIIICENTAEALRKSAGLQRVLEITLALGNYLNGNTSKGGAFGFKLETINKLKNTKSADNKLTLLHFLVKTINSKFNDARSFLVDLNNIVAASKIESGALNADVGKLKASIGKVESELKKADKDSQVDRFYNVMSGFYEVCSKKGNDIEVRVKKLDDVSAALCTYFGEVDKLKLEELFKIFADFVVDFKEAEIALEKIRVQEERDRKKKEEAERQAKLKSDKQKAQEAKDAAALALKLAVNKPSTEEHGEEKTPTNADEKAQGQIVDKVIGALKTSDANEIMKVIRARRRKKSNAVAPPQGMLFKGKLSGTFMGIKGKLGTPLESHDEEKQS